jgi:hypothetical protein
MKRPQIDKAPEKKENSVIPRIATDETRIGNIV